MSASLSSNPTQRCPSDVSTARFEALFSLCNSVCNSAFWLVSLELNSCNYKMSGLCLNSPAACSGHVPINRGGGRRSVARPDSESALSRIPGIPAKLALKVQRRRRQYTNNLFAASDTTYFGLLPFHFAAG
jgi:hypothetical protein